MYKLSQIASITKTKFVGNKDYEVQTFLNDSRNFVSQQNLIFIALKSERNNGHHYIKWLIDNGVQAFLIQEKEFNYTDYLDKNISFIVSKNPLKTIQESAAHHRSQFNIPVIGITGSNGKTIVKEWLYQLLKEEYVICRSPKSYNSQIGVPLSVLHLNEHHKLAIFEAGISKPNEMQHLEKIIQPTITVFTSLGSAHDEGFTSREQKLNEKLILAKNSQTLILNGVEKTNLPCKQITISRKPESDFDITQNGNIVFLKSKTTSLVFELPTNNEAWQMNASTCAVTMLHLGYDEVEIADRIQKLNPVALRLEIKSAINQSILINDFYNSDLDSLQIALNFMQHQNQGLEKIAIISDIEQSGLLHQELYKEVANLMKQNKVKKIIGVGEFISQHQNLFSKDSLFFEDTQAFLKYFPQLQSELNHKCILLKGARSFGFESISQLIQLKSHDTVFEVHLNKLTDNVNYFKGLLKPDVKLMCMVKAMGYGSGSIEVAKSLQFQGVNYLAVAYADEGVELRKGNITLPVMVMNPEEDGFDDIINFNLEPEIYSFKLLKSFVKRLDETGLGTAFPIHIKIDTGMKRLGFDEKEIPELINYIQTHHQIKVVSIFSHLVGSEEKTIDDFSLHQINLFREICKQLESKLGYKVIKHIANSAAIQRFTHAQFDMVRLGIGMYGIGHNAQVQNLLQNVGVLKTRISQIKTVEKDETIGYNRKGVARDKMKIATIAIGYADGFSRQLGNGNFAVFVNGKSCKTIGNICMDMCMIDITKVKCNEGDEVIIFESAAQIHDLASVLKTIPYEVLTNVSARVKRIYLQE